ncbi:MAG: hypothetical protein APF78_06840 [Sphingomonadales bacterium BRH_c3]|nr:MAG: hypothetical protein APF78_06840 [Sphingomonadales bacterium BRH_c3]
MALTYDFLIARAEEAATHADKATLDNVRRMALRSEAAWRDMAGRALSVERARTRARLERVIASSNDLDGQGQVKVHDI